MRKNICLVDVSLTFHFCVVDFICGVFLFSHIDIVMLTTERNAFLFWIVLYCFLDMRHKAVLFL